MQTNDSESRFSELNTKRAEVIQEVMRLRLEQAKLKTELAKIAAESGNLNLIDKVVRCW
jgi:hypothetical protein